MLRRAVVTTLLVAAVIVPVAVIATRSDPPRVSRATETSADPAALGVPSPDPPRARRVGAVAEPASISEQEEQGQELSFAEVALDSRQRAELARSVARAPGGVVLITQDGGTLIAMSYGYCGPDFQVISHVRQTSESIIVTVNQRPGNHVCAGLDRAIGLRTDPHQIPIGTPVGVDVVVSCASFSDC